MHRLNLGPVQQSTFSTGAKLQPFRIENLHYQPTVTNRCGYLNQISFHQKSIPNSFTFFSIDHLFFQPSTIADLLITAEALFSSTVQPAVLPGTYLKWLVVFCWWLICSVGVFSSVSLRHLAACTLEWSLF